jgi:hypothetical protein
LGSFFVTNQECERWMLWMGHKRIDETMLYVHFAEAHLWPLPEAILQTQRGHDDPDRRVIVMLGVRRLVPCGTQVAAGEVVTEKCTLILIT